jgi:hypothetical protein
VPSRDCPDAANGVPGSGQHVACASQGPAARSTLLQNTDSGAAGPTGRPRPDRRFPVRYPRARRVFCAAADERSGRRGQVVAARPDIVTAHDPSADSRDGFTAMFGRSPHVCHQRLEPRTTGHRCAPSSPRRATRDQPLPGPSPPPAAHTRALWCGVDWLPGFSPHGEDCARMSRTSSGESQSPTRSSLTPTYWPEVLP